MTCPVGIGIRAGWILVIGCLVAGFGSPSVVAQPVSSTQETCCQQLASIGFSSNLPVVVLESQIGQEIKHHEDQEILFCTCSTGYPWKDFDGYAKAAGRGSSSASFKKRSYKIELHDSNGTDIQSELLGMPKEEDFVLYGPEFDKSLGMRNYLAYNLGRRTGRYASRTQYVEVFVAEDGKPLSMEDYRGVYIAEEKIKRDKNRVDIHKLKEDNPSGGYIMVYDNDNLDWSDPKIQVSRLGYPIGIKYPKSQDEIFDSGKNLTQFLEDFQAALFADDWMNATGNSSYKSYIDWGSFIDVLLLTEVTKNPDGYRGSVYMFKDRDGPLNAFLPWDYNEAFGLSAYPRDQQYDAQGNIKTAKMGPGAAGGAATNPEGWRFLICEDPKRCIVDPTDGISIWFRRIWRDPSFRKDVASRYKDLRQTTWSDQAVQALIDDAKSQLENGPAQRNTNKYSELLLGRSGGDNGTMWANEVDTLDSWLMERLAWMDSALLGPGLPVITFTNTTPATGSNNNTN